jgi:hypothetical protein
MKRTLVLISFVAAAAFLATASSATQGKPRSGPLHITKECSEYAGTVGGFCTVTSSNIAAIEPGMKVVYLAVPGSGVLDTDIAVGSGQGTALGHVTLDLSTASGRVKLSVGTGRFSGFRAHAVVSVDPSGVWHWDGRYSFGRSDHDSDD